MSGASDEMSPPSTLRTDAATCAWIAATSGAAACCSQHTAVGSHSGGAGAYSIPHIVPQFVDVMFKQRPSHNAARRTLLWRARGCGNATGGCCGGGSTAAPAAPANSAMMGGTAGAPRSSMPQSKGLATVYRSVKYSCQYSDANLCDALPPLERISSRRSCCSLVRVKGFGSPSAR